MRAASCIHYLPVTFDVIFIKTDIAPFSCCQAVAFFLWIGLVETQPSLILLGVCFTACHQCQSTKWKSTVNWHWYWQWPSLRSCSNRTLASWVANSACVGAFLFHVCLDASGICQCTCSGCRGNKTVICSHARRLETWQKPEIEMVQNRPFIPTLALSPMYLSFDDRSFAVAGPHVPG